MGWAGGSAHTADAIRIYMHIHLLLEKRSSRFLRPYVVPLGSWTAIHPSIYPFCSRYLGIVYLTAAGLSVLTVIAIRKLPWFALFSHIILQIALAAFNFPWNEFPSGGKRGLWSGVSSMGKPEKCGTVTGTQRNAVRKCFALFTFLLQLVMFSDPLHSVLFWLVLAIIPLQDIRHPSRLPSCCLWFAAFFGLGARGSASG